MEQFIPLSIPNLEGNEEKYVLDAVRQGWVSTAGKYVTMFEERLAAFLGVPAAAACQSGTCALHLALLECGVGPGDGVIVPTLTFIAAVNPVKYQSARPIFMDCDDSLCMDPVKLKKFCQKECEHTGGRLVHKATGTHIKAVIVVHVFGNMADMESIMDIAGTYGLKVIEDATEALGTRYVRGRYAGRYAGTIGDYGAYSFNGNKIITTGGVGALAAREAGCLEHMRYLSTQAKDDPLFYVHHEVGYNYRMTNVQAAMGVAQMEELPEFIISKQRNYQTYKYLLEDFGYGKLLGFRQGTDANHWFYSLEIFNKNETLRGIVERMASIGIQTRPVWGLVHEQKPYAGELAYEITQAGGYQSRIINLPCSTNLKQGEIERVVLGLKRIF